MIVDDCLFAMIIAGIGLAVGYLRAELGLHRSTTTVQRARELVQREVHAQRVCLGHNKMPQPVLSIQANPFPPVRVLARVSRIFARTQYSSVLDSNLSASSRARIGETARHYRTTR